MLNVGLCTCTCCSVDVIWTSDQYCSHCWSGWRCFASIARHHYHHRRCLCQKT